MDAQNAVSIAQLTSQDGSFQNLLHSPCLTSDPRPHGCSTLSAPGAPMPTMALGHSSRAGRWIGYGSASQAWPHQLHLQPLRVCVGGEERREIDSEGQGSRGPGAPLRSRLCWALVGEPRSLPHPCGARAQQEEERRPLHRLSLEPGLPGLCLLPCPSQGMARPLPAPGPALQPLCWPPEPRPL